MSNLFSMEMEVVPTLRGGRNITVPHKQNRCVIFDSELYHWTGRVNFKRGYHNRRINLTFLYGHPGRVSQAGYAAREPTQTYMLRCWRKYPKIPPKYPRLHAPMVVKVPELPPKYPT
jgi:hypothetical protein